MFHRVRTKLIQTVFRGKRLQNNKRSAIPGIVRIAELKETTGSDFFMHSFVSQSGGVSRRSVMAFTLGSVTASVISGSAFALPQAVGAPKSHVRMVVVQASHGGGGLSNLQMALEWADRRVGEYDLISCLGWHFDASFNGMNDVSAWAHLKSRYVAVAGKHPKLLGPNGECDAYESRNGISVFATELAAIAVGARRSNAIECAGSTQLSADIIVDDGNYRESRGAFVAGLSRSATGPRRGAVIYGPDLEPLTQASGECPCGVVATLNVSALRRDRSKHAQGRD